ncbi:MAG: glucose 1-dehydrogenase [Gammaproteobacteria bacterium]|nr:glucose 1-dehydrogenase [Gammaproteobacteria bacterium]NIR83817.1 glucose 1-dehydrogenase [Gammaproteobacteria bacterium]NIR88234.1 glucose 1-dehydrogenase [Gammaproteobacteria bacterium]NIU05143.1 glucose 1-dehydrogenase [Gammaproteobacteria bacterium]NIV51980.1 glucose 1-dehydrogenase [Gammaproteobacteria bacterium]
MRFNDKTIIVTGGASGIGRATVERFAREGASVVVADVNGGAAREVAELVRAGGGHALAVTVDARDPDAVQALFKATLDEFGGLHVLVNSAAVARPEKILDVTPESWNEIIGVNLTGTFLCAQAAARHMVEAGGGRIINLASVNGQRAITGRGAYSASKGGVIMLTRIMAAELGPTGVTVNAVAPGPVDTAMVIKMHNQAAREAWHRALPIKRYAQPDEVAAAVAFLASEEAAYITGHVLNVDGGFDAAGLLFDL